MGTTPQRPWASAPAAGPAERHEGAVMITSRFTMGSAPAAVVVSLVVAAQLALGSAPALGAARPVARRSSGNAAPGTISTIAGGVGGPAPARTVAFLDGPTGLAYAGGHLYVTDAYVRAISMRTGRLTTAVGAYSLPTLGFSHIPVRDGHPAIDANTSPDGVAVATNHNLLVADTYHDRVRVVAAKAGKFYGVPMKAGDIYTVAGDGRAGFSGDGGPAGKALVDHPMALAATTRTRSLCEPATGCSPTRTTTGCGWWRPRPARSMAWR